MSPGENVPLVLNTNIKMFLVQLSPPHNEFSQSIVDCFGKIDKDKDGFLGKTEITKALGDPQFTDKDAAMLATLRVCFSEFEDLSDDEWGIENDGITRADVTAYDRLCQKDPKNKLVKKIQSWYDYAKMKIQNANKQLFNGEIDPLNVKQGMVGDCWLLAAIVGSANIESRKQEIARMITPIENDKYQVKFPGIADPIAVAKPTDSEIALFSGAESNGLWLSILEKAYGTSVNQKTWFFLEDSPYDAISGDIERKGIMIITGHNVNIENLIAIAPKSIEIMHLGNKINISMNAGKVVTAGIRKSFSKYTEAGLRRSHVYTVVGYDNNSDTVKVRNPWGHGGENWPKEWTINKGVFLMSLKAFWDNFSVIAFEE